MRRLHVLLLGALLMVSLSAVRWSPGAAFAAPRSVLRVAIPVLPRTLDPNVDSSLVHFKVWHLLYDTLVAVDASGKAEPRLATAWRILSPTTWEFKLRRGVKFHNGEDFDAEAVRATLSYILDPASRSTWAQRFTLIADVKMVDPYTVQIITTQPFPLLAKTLAVAFILPPKYLAKAGAGKFGLTPVGTGPFRVRAFRSDEYAQFEAFGGYWGAKPKVASVLMRQIREASGRTAGLEAGEIDIAYEISVEQVERLRSRNLNVVASVVGASYLVNLKTMVKPLDDARVRRALNYATDATAINNALLLGLSRPLQGQMVGPNSTGFNPAIKAYPYDPERARQLLSEAGYPNGFRITFEGSNGRFYKDKEIAETVCAQWAKVRVTCDLVLLESNVWLQHLVSGVLGPVSAAPWQTAPQLDLEVPVTNFLSTGPRKMASIPAIDEWFAQQRGTMNPVQRLYYLHKLAEVIYEEAPVVFLFENIGAYALSPKVGGARFRPDYSFDPVAINLGD
ncbi:MAG TPA: ABC transporter substrate-binding protein [Anaerolineales bacterium]|nr:ABC transporter substrate-binding protein [Anaerolineales bacterium]